MYCSVDGLVVCVRLSPCCWPSLPCLPRLPRLPCLPCLPICQAVKAAQAAPCPAPGTVLRAQVERAKTWHELAVGNHVWHRMGIPHFPISRQRVLHGIGACLGSWGTPGLEQ